MGHVSSTVPLLVVIYHQDLIKCTLYLYTKFGSSIFNHSRDMDGAPKSLQEALLLQTECATRLSVESVEILQTMKHHI